MLAFKSGITILPIEAEKPEMSDAKERILESRNEMVMSRRLKKKSRRSKVVREDLSADAAERC